MDDSLVEVVEISDESLSEAEEVEITEPGPSIVPLKASPPVMLIGKNRQRNTMSPVRTIDLTESNDEEAKKCTIARSYSPFNNKFNRNKSITKTISSKSDSEEKYFPNFSNNGKESLFL